MADIKLKNVANKGVKTIDKAVVQTERFKDTIVRAKEKGEESVNNDSNANEYGSNKIKYVTNRGTDEVIHQFNKQGQKAVLKTKKNYQKSQIKIKAFKNKMDIKKNSKYPVEKTKNTIKTSSEVVKNTQKVAKETVKTSQKAMQYAKESAKKTAQGIKAAVKATISAVKGIIAGTKALISALVAGGWLAFIVTIVICLIGLLCGSIFGIFFSSENTDNKTMSSVISDLNNELSKTLINIQNENLHDDYVLNINKSEWKYVLSVYAVIVSKGQNATDVITINDNKTSVLKDVFWKMNEITYNVQETPNENGEIKRTLYINITGKSVNDVIAEYNLNFIQQKQINELLSNKYESLWSNVVYGGGTGNKNVVDIALSQVGNIGGELYWRWYGFNSRVEWCAVFVSWVYNQAGILNTAVPKFSTCHTQGVPWFKAIGLWKEKGYAPKPGDVIFFDWEQDGHTDHVGIVEKSDGKNVYTIEGNSRDEVKKRKYSINSKYFYGYGLPKYNK